MVAFEKGKLVCTHPARTYADAVVSELRKREIAADVVRSNRHPGEWDMMVPVYAPGRATWVVSALLARG